MPLVITDVSSFDEAGAQLVRLDAHFQTDCRARRARLHHVLPSPRMRALKGMWRSVAAWEGKGLDVATYLGTIGAAIQEDSGTKTEVSHGWSLGLGARCGPTASSRRDTPGRALRQPGDAPWSSHSQWDTSAFVPESAFVSARGTHNGINAAKSE